MREAPRGAFHGERIVHLLSYFDLSNEEGPKGAHSVMTRVNADGGIVAVRPLVSHS